MQDYDFEVEENLHFFKCITSVSPQKFFAANAIAIGPIRYVSSAEL